MSINLNPWQSSLEHISAFPYLSSTFAVIHGDRIAEYAGFLANEIFGDLDKQTNSRSTVAIFAQDKPNFSAEAGLKSSTRAIVTYLALRALSSLSLYINGAIGLGKMALGLTLAVATSPSTEKYKQAQNLFETGVFQLAAGVADFCIGQYTLAAAGLALANGLMPEKTQDIINRAFIWKGDIQLSDHASAEELETLRSRYSWLQTVADKTQRFVLPDAGASRIQAFISGNPRN